MATVPTNAPSGKQFRKKEFKSNHSTEILLKLNEERKSYGDHCDATLWVGAHVFPIHKCVICVFADFFQNMFTLEMKEKQDNKADVKGISVDTMETILNFIYTSEITITNYNVYDVLAAADYMQIPYIKEYCQTFLFETVSFDNCFNVRAFAISCNDGKLIAKANRFIGEKFAAICAEDEYKELDLDDFTAILQLKHKKASEEVVYQAVIGWIDYEHASRQQHLNKLFAFIKLDRLPNDFLQQVVAKQPYVMSSLECSNLIVHTLLERHNKPPTPCPPAVEVQQVPQASQHFASTPQSPPLSPLVANTSQYGVDLASVTTRLTKLDAPLKQGSAQQSQASKGGKKTKNRKRGIGAHKKFLVLGGSGSAKNVAKYHIPKMNTTGMPGLNVGRYGAAAVNVDNKVYVMGGQTNKMEKLDLNENCGWTELESMNQSRQYLSATVLNGHIYASGGVSFSLSQSSVEEYDVEGNDWMDIPSMLHRRSAHALVAGNGALYAVGGWAGKEKGQILLNTVESLDPRVGRWNNEPAMSTYRSGLAAVIFNNDIYAIGGANANGDIQSSVIRLDTRSKAWCPVGFMTEPRQGHCACVVGQKIFVVGGNKSKTVEAYDPATNMWTVVAPLNSMRNFACAVPA
ncbi:kelch-like protein 23 [Clavelina lepadiformis]|uniref:kelch-like protein 23 n=1 Tax=Clavelina lepadiformis TaxID=159417 RepID=UPI004041E55B